MFMNDDYLKCSRRYSVSYMSNAKWRKLFLSLADANVQYAEWSFIDSEHTMIESLPSESDLLESGFADGRFQPFEYKWIRSIEIPNKFRHTKNIGYFVKQDIELIKNIVSQLGEMPIFETENGIKIIGYEK